jgi:hypothetical protein
MGRASDRLRGRLDHDRRSHRVRDDRSRRGSRRRGRSRGRCRYRRRSRSRSRRGRGGGRRRWSWCRSRCRLGSRRRSRVRRRGRSGCWSWSRRGRRDWSRRRSGRRRWSRGRRSIRGRCGCGRRGRRSRWRRVTIRVRGRIGLGRRRGTRAGHRARSRSRRRRRRSRRIHPGNLPRRIAAVLHNLGGLIIFKIALVERLGFLAALHRLGGEIRAVGPDGGSEENTPDDRNGKPHRNPQNTEPRNEPWPARQLLEIYSTFEVKLERICSPFRVRHGLDP